MESVLGPLHGLLVVLDFGFILRQLLQQMQLSLSVCFLYLHLQLQHFLLLSLHGRFLSGHFLLQVSGLQLDGLSEYLLSSG
jgi:hypothetical protein